MTDPGADGFDTLAAELAAAFAEGIDTAWTEARFDDHARRVFAWQFEAGGAYRRFCEGRRRTPAEVRHWWEVPAVPTSAFKHLDLSHGPVEVEFQTSGTSRGPHTRGRHCVRSLALYRAASLPNLRAHLLPEGGRIRILSLIPSAAEAPTSSLSRMMAFAFDALGDEGSGSLSDPAAGLRMDALAEELTKAARAGVPVWIAGTAFAFVHWIDAVERGAAPAVALPEGSRILETGGFKGRSREVARVDLYRALERVLGVSPQGIVNEYGMTELLSQFYDGVAGDPRRPPPEERVHRPPPWMRTRVLDPVTLEAVPPGEAGLLAHFDLANLGSVSAVLTEDRGEAVEGGGFRVLGRASGAEPRGCSMALEDLLEARGPGGWR